MYSVYFIVFFFFKQKTAYEMRISDWSSDVCSSYLIDNSGGHVTFNKYCMRNHTVFYPTPTNFVVRTYVNPKLLRPEQHEIVREMEAWLAAHQAEAEAAVMQYHRLEDNDQGEFLDSASWATLQADFQALWPRLSAQF